MKPHTQTADTPTGNNTTGLIGRYSVDHVAESAKASTTSKEDDKRDKRQTALDNKEGF
jgi:DNA-directed RNA polymerase delta subunit